MTKINTTKDGSVIALTNYEITMLIDALEYFIDFDDEDDSYDEQIKLLDELAE